MNIIMGKKPTLVCRGYNTNATVETEDLEMHE